MMPSHGYQFVPNVKPSCRESEVAWLTNQEEGMWASRCWKKKLNATNSSTNEI
jgi:hypothetical protein